MAPAARRESTSGRGEGVKTDIFVDAGAVLHLDIRQLAQRETVLREGIAEGHLQARVQDGADRLLRPRAPVLA